MGIHFWPPFSFIRGLRIDYLSPVIYITDLLIAALFVFWLYEKQRGIIDFVKKIKNIPLPGQSLKCLLNASAKHPLRVVLALTAIYLLLKAFFAQFPLLALYGLLKYLEMVFFGYYIASNIKTKKQLRTIALIFSVSLIIQSLIAVFQYINQSSLGGVLYFIGERKFSASTPGIANASINGSLILRPYAVFPHPNVLAGFLLTGMIFIFAFLRGRENIFFTVLKFTSLSLASVALMLSLSRVAILVWIALIIYLFTNLIRKQSPAMKKFNYLFTLILIAFMAFIFFNLPVFSRFMSSSLLEKSVTVRQDLAGTAFKAIFNSPLYGVGHYHFLPFRGATAPPDGGFNSIQPVHNIFLLITAENGLIGLILFFTLLMYAFKHLLKNKNSYKLCMFLILLVIILLGLFDHYWLTVQQGQLLLALFLGLSWAL